MEGNDVLVGFFGISIEFPDSKDNVIERNDMMTFQIIGGVADEAERSFVFDDPIVVVFGPTNFSFNVFDDRISHHSYYRHVEDFLWRKMEFMRIENGIYAYWKWDWHEMTFREWVNQVDEALVFVTFRIFSEVGAGR